MYFIIHEMNKWDVTRGGLTIPEGPGTSRGPMSVSWAGIYIGSPILCLYPDWTGRRPYVTDFHWVGGLAGQCLLLLGYRGPHRGCAVTVILSGWTQSSFPADIDPAPCRLSLTTNCFDVISTICVYHTLPNEGTGIPARGHTLPNAGPEIPIWNNVPLSLFPPHLSLSLVWSI